MSQPFFIAEILLDKPRKPAFFWKVVKWVRRVLRLDVYVCCIDHAANGSDRSCKTTIVYNKKYKTMTIVDMVF